MNTPRTALAVLATLGAGALFAADASAHWPQFRGANASGLAAGANPPLKVGPTDAVVWSVEVPWSPSSPAIWGDRIFLTTWRDGLLETRCHNRADGKLQWARGVKPAAVEDFHRSDGSPAASSPATDGRHVVSYFGSFGLICHDVDGLELWRLPLPLALSAGQYGSGTSPIIVGDRVVLCRDLHRFSTLLAVDVKTGRKLWETPRPEASGSFGTPVHWKNNGVDEVVIAANSRLKGFDLKTGRERWVVENVTGYVCTTPVIEEGMLFFAAWSNDTADSPLPTWEEFYKKYDKNGDGIVTFDEIAEASIDYWRGVDANRDGKFSKEDWDIMSAEAKTMRSENVIVAVKPGGTGNITESHVAWRFRKGLPYVPSPVAYGGRIYFVKDGGILTSLDAKTGEPAYVQERIANAPGGYYASLVAADGRLYVASLPGKLTVIKAGGDKPEILHQADFGERILATPAIVGDQLYVRTTTKLWAFGK
ncbi:MAG: PQQ-binding-like beta-propeller repeat protein [Opitutaceae bacterium]|nr:PQQ-binding-like beta-propeller repeat protein [Opitutaceae bacterium]